MNSKPIGVTDEPTRPVNGHDAARLDAPQFWRTWPDLRSVGMEPSAIFSHPYETWVVVQRSGLHHDEMQCARGTRDDVSYNDRTTFSQVLAQGTMTGAPGNWMVHTAAKAGCPGTARQVQRGGNNLKGFAETGDMAGVSRLSGTIDANQQFTITMTQVDCKGPQGTITGSRSASDGWLVAQVKGSGCTDVPLKIMTYVPFKG
jgi:hypothetical protein